MHGNLILSQWVNEMCVSCRRRHIRWAAQTHTYFKYNICRKWTEPRREQQTQMARVMRLRVAAEL